MTEASASRDGEVKHRHIIVTGEFLTAHARTLWADEHQPARAIDLLTTCLRGIELAQVIDVLTGRSRLIGDSDGGVELVDDDATESAYGAPLPSLPEAFSMLTERAKRAERNLRDHVELQAGNGVMVASPNGQVQVSRQTRDELGAGEIQWEDVYVYRSVREVRDAERRRWMAESGPPPELPPDPPPKPPESFSAITSDTGWLGPDGRFYPCGYQEHIGVADRICRDRTIDAPLGERKLEELGWVKLAGRLGPFEGERAPTEAQRRRVLDWCLGDGRELTKLPYFCEPEEG